MVLVPRRGTPRLRGAAAVPRLLATTIELRAGGQAGPASRRGFGLPFAVHTQSLPGSLPTMRPCTWPIPILAALALVAPALADPKHEDTESPALLGTPACDLTGYKSETHQFSPAFAIPDNS